ncbi:thiosulfate/3-mercaptopyruvate sulfurtransferase [Paramicrobacterium humi]|uniref:Thiosulfate/3-mercaptopyruvate sulfurtransferase n=1 Tax=Paramicrobacterium humi TaxID=640635 RepID=A0A1H4P0C6_9MICO|nr:sulfurtransferase [Microbacterium humi]SEC00849.1 thiosulfate/3-mercaptopyruvate sulfurtransferase [Microbacterium humi]
MMRDLISPAELAELLGEGRPVRVLDVRWTLQKPDGRDDYVAGHIPGAVYVDLDEDLAAHGRPATEGRHPLPGLDDLQRTVRRLGINDGDTVVAYDGWNAMGAARAWWVLGWAGIGDVKVLNGGIDAWTAAGKPLERGEVRPEPGTATLSPGSRPSLDIDAAAELAARGRLVDSRAPERFRGDVEPMDPKPGHIPGAVNVPSSRYLDEAGRILPAERVRELFAELAADGDLGVYCGSGVTAANTALALHEAGIAASLYPGSWSQWSNLPDRPVALGD